ncbi:MAG: elongation factor P [Chloroflexota bacterium]|nr:elongation factor P [Chloroflexota bacterium]
MKEVQTLRKGDIYQEESHLWRVLDYQHIKMARGGATIRLKLRNVRTGSTVERTFNNGERLQDVELDSDEVQYQYNDGQFYYFMNTATFEQLILEPKALDDVIDFLIDNQVITLESFDGEPISIRLPTTVDLKVIWAEAAVAGDTADAPSKQIELETGYKMQVPMFVNQGDLVRVNTRDGSYVTRIKQ